jgi:hypothetical protein
MRVYLHKSAQTEVRPDRKALPLPGRTNSRRLREAETRAVKDGWLHVAQPTELASDATRRDLGPCQPRSLTDAD